MQSDILKQKPGFMSLIQVDMGSEKNHSKWEILIYYEMKTKHLFLQFMIS
jgi:hypothetical protein